MFLCIITDTLKKVHIKQSRNYWITEHSELTVESNYSFTKFIITEGWLMPFNGSDITYNNNDKSKKLAKQL